MRILALDRRDRQRRALRQFVEHSGIVKHIAHELERALDRGLRIGGVVSLDCLLPHNYGNT